MAGTPAEPSEDVGTRVPTPVEWIVGKSLEDVDESLTSAWVRVGAGKWQTRDFPQQTGTPIYVSETTTMVQPFTADKKAARELLTSDGKWSAFLGQQLHSRAANLTLEEIE